MELTTGSVILILDRAERLGDKMSGCFCYIKILIKDLDMNFVNHAGSLGGEQLCGRYIMVLFLEYQKI